MSNDNVLKVFKDSSDETWRIDGQITHNLRTKYRDHSNNGAKKEVRFAEGTTPKSVIEL